MSVRDNTFNAAYIRRQIGGDDLAFQQGNLAWNNERAEHLLGCLLVSVQAMSVSRFAEFHTSKVEEFNATCKALEAIAGQDQNWFDQVGSVDHCRDQLRVTTQLIMAIVELVERV